MKHTNSPDARDWLLASLLILLIAVPVGAGAVRLVQLAAGAEVTDANARFFAAPLPVVVHVVSAALFCIGGTFQVVPGFRRASSRWHRAAGRILIPCGLLAGLSGLWMTAFYPHVPGDGALLFAFRLLFGSAMVASIGLGVAAIRRRDFAAHGAWLLRGYAIAQGTGTQFLLIATWMLLLGVPGELQRALLMGAGWGLNVAFAEWLLRRQARPRSLAVRRAAGHVLGRGMPDFPGVSPLSEQARSETWNTR